MNTTFIYEIIKITRGLEKHPYHDLEVVGVDSIELNTYGFTNPIEIFSEWASKAQKEYSKLHKTDARDSYFFRYPVNSTTEEE